MLIVVMIQTPALWLSLHGHPNSDKCTLEEHLGQTPERLAPEWFGIEAASILNSQATSALNPRRPHEDLSLGGLDVEYPNEKQNLCLLAKRCWVP